MEAICPDFWKLVSKDAKVEKVATGFQFTEGPVWLRNNTLLFSDIPANTIYSLRNGRSCVFRTPSGNSNGLTIDKLGRLICCEHSGRRVSRYEQNGAITSLVSHYQGKRLNSPNDVVVSSDGAIYFTDPPYGVEDKDRELDFQGVYRLSADGSLILLVRDFDRPNGLAFSPDEKTIYIADSSARMHIRAFDVNSDGILCNGRIFAEMKSSEPGAPDGLKVDSLGNVWATGPGGIWVFDKAGRHLGIIRVPEVPANCAWGDEDAKMLYITARKSLYRIRTNVIGLRP